MITLAAFALWWVNLGSIDESQVGGIGLISVLPLGTILAPVILAAGFAIALNAARPFGFLLAADLVLLVLMLHGLPSFIQEVPSFSTTYVHAGFAEAMMRTGHLFVERDARFSWPLFFALLAYLTSIAGLENPIQLAAWVPALSNLLYLVPLWLIFRALTTDRRLVWLGLCVFVFGNWVGQDYMSPQGFNVLLYLTVLAILLTWFRRRDPAPLGRLAARVRARLGGHDRDGEVAGDIPEVRDAPAGQKIGLMLILSLLCTVVVASHQLTPFALFLATLILVVTRKTTVTSIPVLMGVLIGTWLSYMTLAFLAGHISSLFAELLQPEAVATASVGDRLRGNPGHVFVVYERLAFSALVWGLALLGGLRRFRNGHWDLTAILLAGYPFAFLAMQSYGGELMLRVYLFTLPLMSFLAAGLVFPKRLSVSRWQPVAIVALAGVMMFGFLVARYGNDRADRLTADEVAGTERAVSLVPVGAVIASSNHNSPLGYSHYDRYERVNLSEEFVYFEPEAIARALRDIAAGRPAFMFLTESQREFFDLFGFPEEEWDAVVQQMKESGAFKVVFQTRDTILLELALPPSPTP